MIYNQFPLYTVYQINQYIKSLITNNENLRYILVKGEVSNLKIQDKTGHFYFSLKDSQSIISAVMFNTYSKKLNFQLQNGQEVIALCSVDCYSPRGTYQLLITALEPVGEGQELLELKKLKEKLFKEGLFDESRKKSINIYPHRIGVITAKNSAAIKDIVFNIKRRYPICEIYFFPSQVQGEGAIESLKSQFNKTKQYDLDTIIIGRGGGASEDLNAFNDESLVRLLSNSKVPIISAVGHEIDTTLVDLVADKRASTPTGACELAVVDKREIIEKLNNFKKSGIEIIVNNCDEIKENIVYYKEELKKVLINNISHIGELINSKKETLDSLNPFSILSRGYTIVYKDEHAISSTQLLNEGEVITIKFKDGDVKAQIKEIKKDK
ncbi:MAG: exodeoxyribonuclease VII large subunit [Bacilli bacterium]